MPIDFPPSANTGYIHTEGNFSYQFTGSKWKPVNRVDYTVQESNIDVSSNAVIIDMSKDGIQTVNLTTQTDVSFSNPPGLNEYEKVLINFTIDPAYVGVNTTNVWDVSAATFGTEKSLTDPGTNPYKAFFRPDGLKMYILKNTSGTVYQYNLTTAWDVSTATYETGKFKLVTGQVASPLGLFFKPDGLKMYIVGENNIVYQYALSQSTPWDVSTATFETTKTKSVNTGAAGIFFRPDGFKMYVLSNADSTVYQYNLTTQWEVSTATFETGKSKALSDAGFNTLGIFFRPDGLKMYIAGFSNGAVYQYKLTTEWEITSATYETGKFKSVTAQDSTLTSVFFKPDGYRMYTIGRNTNKVYQYNFTTPDTIVDVTWPSTIEWESGYAPSLPSPQQSALIEIEARTDYIGTNYVGHLVGTNF